MASADGDGPVDATGSSPAALLEIEVVYSPAPRSVERVALRLQAPATAADALQRSGLLERHGLTLQAVAFGIWGRRCEAGAVLRTRDRVEIYRALLVDPKEARRLRYRKHRSASVAG